MRKYYLIQNGSLSEEARTIYASVPARRDWEKKLHWIIQVGSFFQLISDNKKWAAVTSDLRFLICVDS